jgi:hypothetical protein
MLSTSCIEQAEEKQARELKPKPKQNGKGPPQPDHSLAPVSGLILSCHSRSLFPRYGLLPLARTEEKGGTSCSDT